MLADSCTCWCWEIAQVLRSSDKTRQLVARQLSETVQVDTFQMLLEGMKYWPFRTQLAYIRLACIQLAYIQLASIRLACIRPASIFHRCYVHIEANM